MSTQPTAVLVHGAFADASGYACMIGRLQAQGVAVRAGSHAALIAQPDVASSLILKALASL